MGCICSRGNGETRDFQSLSDEFSGIHKSGLHSFDSGELRMTPPLPTPKTKTGKLPEMSSIIGRAGTATLERAVEVLDTIGSSISNLASNSGFVSNIAPRGNKISILAFEVANTIAKGANLLRSLSEDNIQLLKDEVLKSDGIKELVSADYGELMIIAAADKRDELNVFASEVIRFGNLCKEPVWHNLGRYFQKLGSELSTQEKLNEEVETSMQQLLDLAQNTSELYHEVNTLDRFELDYQRKLHEEGALPAARRENLMILHSELKHQRKLVKNLKKRSLWSRNLEEVVEVLVDVVVYLHKAILEAFGITDTDLAECWPARNQSLGVAGLALHYANIINQIDNIVSRPLSLPPNTRNALYQGLPTGVKAALRSKLQSCDAKQEYSPARIKAEIQKTLRWIVPLAENTIRAHQGFGWVGEWANICAETNKKQLQQQSIARIETLYHADKKRTEECILRLVVGLHHLVIQVRNRGNGFKFMKPVHDMAEQGKPTDKNMKNLSLESKGESKIILELSEEDRDVIKRVDSKKIVLGRSKSLDLVSGKEKSGDSNCGGLSRSLGNSPSKKLNMALFEWTKVLDVLDGLDTCS